MQVHTELAKRCRKQTKALKLHLLANPFGQGLRFVEPTYVTGQEDPASRDSTAQSMSFHSGARDSNTLPK